MSDLVTGEAVRLDLRPASFASRLVSGVIDLLIQLTVLIMTLVITARLGNSLDFAAAAALYVALTLFILVGIPVVVETLTRGRTLGKLIMGMRTVRDDGGPIRFRHALTRGLIGLVELWLLWGIPALFFSLFHPKSKRVGDAAAGTYVLRVRGVQQRAMMAHLPPSLTGWAATVDIGRLPDGMALAVRQFLGRAPSMHNQARQQVGQELARAISPYVAPAPPTGTHPEEFLAGVLAERRRRDIDRLSREEHQRRRLADVDTVDAALARVHR